MAGGVGHTAGLINPGAEDAEPVILIPVGLPCLETHPNFFQPFSRNRVDLLSYESKPMDKREQYDWRTEKNLDGKRAPSLKKEQKNLQHVLLVGIF